MKCIASCSNIAHAFDQDLRSDPNCSVATHPTPLLGYYREFCVSHVLSPKKTRRHGDTGTRRVLVRRATRGMKRREGANVQGFEAPSKTWTLGIGRGFNPRPIPLPASPRP